MSGLKRDTILVVCTGNVCRSPMAAALLRHALDAEQPPLRDYRVTSAGTAAYPDELASANSVAAARRIKLDLSQHRSQDLSTALIERAAFIIGMTDSHLFAIKRQFPAASDRLLLFREFLPQDQIPDPYGQNLDAYLECRDSMVEAIPSLMEHFRAKLVGNED